MSLDDLVQTLVTVVKTDANKSLLPLIVTLFSSIASNPTGLNIVAQLTKFNVGLLALGPQVGQDILIGIAKLVNNEAQQLLAAPPAK